MLSLWQLLSVQLEVDNLTIVTVLVDQPVVSFYVSIRPKSTQEMNRKLKISSRKKYNVFSKKIHLNRFGQIHFIDIYSYFAHCVIMRISIVVQNLQNELFAGQLIAWNRKFKVLVEIRMVFAAWNGRFTFTIVYFRRKHQTNIWFTKATVLDCK